MGLFLHFHNNFLAFDKLEDLNAGASSGQTRPVVLVVRLFSLEKRTGSKRFCRRKQPRGHHNFGVDVLAVQLGDPSEFCVSTRANMY